MGPRHAGALRRSRQAGSEPGDDEGETGRDRHRDAAAREDPQVSGHRQAAARRGRHRRLHREGQRGGGALRERRRQDPDDDLERDDEQDPPRHEDSEDKPQLHPGRRLRAQRPRIERRRQGSGRRRRRRHRRGRGNTKRRACRGAGARGRAARRQAAEPEAPRHHQLRRWRAAHQGILDAPRAHAAEFPAVGADLRPVQALGSQHGDLQRRWHRHVQHHDQGAGLHRPAGRQLHLHGRAVPGDRRRER